jgi:hypothetical protein
VERCQFFQFLKLDPHVQNLKKYRTQTGIEILLLFQSADLYHYQTQAQSLKNVLSRTNDYSGPPTECIVRV